MIKPNEPTTDHHQIRQWAQAHSARPALIDHPIGQADKIGLRLDFEGKFDERDLPSNTNHPTDWETFFHHFETQKLAFELVDPKALDPTDAYRFIPRPD